RKLRPRGRSLAPARRRDAGSVPEEEAGEDLPLRLVALAGARLGWAEPGPRARGGAHQADPRCGVARGCTRRRRRAGTALAAVSRLGRQGRAAFVRRADAAALRARAALDQGDPRDVVWSLAGSAD